MVYWCALVIAVKNYNKSLEKLQDFFFKTDTNIVQDQDQDSCLSSRRLETKTLVASTKSLLQRTFIRLLIRDFYRPDADYALLSPSQRQGTEGISNHLIYSY